MEVIALTIEWIYLALRSDDREDLTLTDEDIVSAVDSADVV
jgi:hypothetical protein